MPTLLAPARAALKAAAFFLKVLPTLPSRPVNWLTPAPVFERVTFETTFGKGTGLLYRPPGNGPHPGIVVCLGVVPFGFDHPQIPRLGEALARSGFAALLYRSSLMEDYRLEPEDVGNVAAAYQHLTGQRYVDPNRSGLFGTCVGGSFALMAAAHPKVRERVGFVGAFAPYASMRYLVLQIASATKFNGHSPMPWRVDQLTRKVFVHSITSMLEPAEASLLREAVDGSADGIEADGLSPEGQAVHAMLAANDLASAKSAYDALPSALKAQIEAISPTAYLPGILAPLMVLGHDRDDDVVPIGESRRLRDALRQLGHRGVRYTEFGLFQHADPTKRNLSPPRLAWELGKFYRYVFPLFRTGNRPM